MGNLYIPNSIALRNFDSLFSKNNFDFSDGQAAISFHPTYVAMHPVGLAFYAALSDYFEQNGIKKTATINNKIKSIPYLQRMGLFDVLGFENPVKTAVHEETGRFIPLTKVRNGVELDTFIKSIDPILHTTRNNSRVIKHVFSELLRNVIEHSEAPLGGNVCATYNKRQKKISIGISDSGKGLFEALRTFHPVTNYCEAIRSALTPGISGTTAKLGGTEENAGAGLFFTKCIAQSTRNHFLIYSGDSYFKLNLTPKNKTVSFVPDPTADKCSVRSALPPFTGTLVGIDISITDSTVFNNLIDNIGNAYRLSVKKATKDYSGKIQFS